MASAEGAELGAANVDYLIDITRRVLPATTPSMMQNALAGQRTEADIIQGAAVECGRRMVSPLQSTSPCGL